MPDRAVFTRDEAAHAGQAEYPRGKLRGQSGWRLGVTGEGQLFVGNNKSSSRTIPSSPFDLTLSLTSPPLPRPFPSSSLSPESTPRNDSAFVSSHLHLVFASYPSTIHLTRRQTLVFQTALLSTVTFPSLASAALASLSTNWWPLYTRHDNHQDGRLLVGPPPPLVLDFTDRPAFRATHQSCPVLIFIDHSLMAPCPSRPTY